MTVHSPWRFLSLKWQEDICARVCGLVKKKEMLCIHVEGCACVYQLRGEGGGQSSEAARASISTQSSQICQTTPAEKTHYPCLVASSASVVFSLLYLGLPCLRVRWQSAFLQVFLKLSGVFCFILFIYLFVFPILFLFTSLFKQWSWWVLIPTWVPLQMTLLAWCQTETNREQRFALDKRGIRSGGRVGERERGSRG